MQENLTNMLLVILIVLVSLTVFILIFQLVYGGDSVRKIVCGALFWLPFGSILSALTHGCAIVPA
jgi:glycopeptide antibiotics resistance protein